MSGPRPPEIQPPVRFRTTVHPEPSLPPLDLKQTSLVGRVVEEVLFRVILVLNRIFVHTYMANGVRASWYTPKTGGRGAKGKKPYTFNLRMKLGCMAQSLQQAPFISTNIATFWCDKSKSLLCRKLLVFSRRSSHRGS